MAKTRLIKFDPQGCFIPKHGITADQVSSLESRMLEVRDEVLKVDLQLYADGPVPSDKEPLDAGFTELPERLLDAYHSDRANSELNHILETASRIKEAVDRVVVLGIGGSYMGARALMECCCQPYFNEFSRAERGSRPRMYFCLLYTSPSPRDGLLSRMPSSA